MNSTLPRIGVTLDAEAPAEPPGYSRYPWYALRANYAEALAGGAHEPGHVRPRAVGALGHRGRLVVEDAVEDLQAGIGDPDLVHIRVGQHDARPRSRLVTDVELAPRISAGARDAGQESG